MSSSFESSHGIVHPPPHQPSHAAHLAAYLEAHAISKSLVAPLALISRNRKSLGCRRHWTLRLVGDVLFRGPGPPDTYLGGADSHDRNNRHTSSACLTSIRPPGWLMTFCAFPTHTKIILGAESCTSFNAEALLLLSPQHTLESLTNLDSYS